MLKQLPEAPERVFHALGDPTRVAMVERLSRRPATVSELARPLPMSLSAVVQHLAVLERSGLVSSRKAGRVRTCRIEPAALRVAEDWVAQRRALWEERLDRLADYLAETADTHVETGDAGQTGGDTHAPEDSERGIQKKEIVTNRKEHEK
ncbi:MAG TPA: metalloregulator ArsR/SmtB family transcription factor [Solirubrobacteraceae bacterium]|jgi:DNA-binding transcriptional ArsR family regulator|nr:metalloregulator ArsR/SmtB family transcription factor [Solirubrobacteraceae bacterium]